MKIDKYLQYLEMSVENFPGICLIFCIKTISSTLRVGVVMMQKPNKSTNLYFMSDQNLIQP